MIEDKSCCVPRMSISCLCFGSNRKSSSDKAGTETDWDPQENIEISQFPLLLQAVKKQIQERVNKNKQEQATTRSRKC